MKTGFRSVSVKVAAWCFITAAAAPAEEGLWYEAEAAAGDPLALVNRVGLGFDHTEGDAQKEKLTLGVTWTLGQKTGRHDWALAAEIPLLLNQPDGSDSDGGVGDFKLRLAHTWIENETWLAGSYVDAEFDTAASNVEAIANQRNQLTVGTGFIRNLNHGWAFGAAVQYGWSVSEGVTNGDKSEIEFRAGLRKKLSEAWSVTVLHKSIVNLANANHYTSAVEPSVNWDVGCGGKFSVFAACEVPLEHGREDFTAKAGLAWVY